jgi:hypothetical protein
MHLRAPSELKLLTEQHLKNMLSMFSFRVGKEAYSDHVHLCLIPLTVELSSKFQHELLSTCFKMIVFGTYLGQFEGAGQFYQRYDKIECKNMQYFNLFGS